MQRFNLTRLFIIVLVLAAIGFSAPSARAAGVHQSPGANITGAIVLAVALGVVGRVLVPYLEMVRDNPGTKFDRQFLLPPLISIIIALIGLPIVLSQVPPELLEVEQLSLTAWVALFLVGWGGTDLFREAQKFVTPSKAK